MDETSFQELKWHWEFVCKRRALPSLDISNAGAGAWSIAKNSKDSEGTAVEFSPCCEDI